MLELIEWLMKVERLALEFYREASEYYKEDETMYSFLKLAREDETMHYNTLERARSEIVNENAVTADISISRENQRQIENLFILNLERLLEKTLTQEQFLDCIAETEFSEWNKIFCYVVNSLKKEIHQFEVTAAKIQGHLGRTQIFLESFPYGAKKLKEIINLERVFVENILIVEDDDVLSELMSSLLEDIGNVELAYDGRQALEKLAGKYYKLIITDVKMPEMDGIELYNAAVEKYHNLRNRFVFTSGFIDEENRAFFSENDITVVQKPADVGDILYHASRILSQP